MPARKHLETLPVVVRAGSGSSPKLEAHTNPGLEIVYIERGHLHWQVEGHVELVGPRSVFFTLPWQRHGSVLDFEPGHRWHFAILRVNKLGSLSKPGPFTFPDSLALDARVAQRMTQLFRRTQRHAYPATSLMSELLPRLVREFHTPPSTTRSAMLSHLTGAALLELASIIERSRASGNADDSSDRRAAELVEQLTQRCDEPWTLAAMSHISGLGRTRLAQLLREQTGDTPLRLVNRLRIARARRMLVAPENQSVTRIALACGFSTSQHFAEVFRQYTGLSPGQYRKQRG